MLSSQGASTTLSNGITVNQTIGQQSVIGTWMGDIDVQQGFQQSFWSQRIAQNETLTAVKVMVYPNPFVTTVNFQFSQTIASGVSILVFDQQGRIVLNVKKTTIVGLTTIDLSSLPDAMYLVQLSASNFNYYTKIIKRS
jgi:hypothetical protein